jgi:hypothetical protein
MGENLVHEVEVIGRDNRGTSLEIEVQGRWDALALSEMLISYHSFLVQFDCQRWVVHARVPGCHGEPLDAAMGKIEDWLADRSLEEISCRVGGRPYEQYAKEVA